MQKIDSRKLVLVILSLLILLVIALLVGRLTFAFMGTKVENDPINQGEITAAGDYLIFNKGKAIVLNATADNFKTGGENLSKASNPSVRLVANNKNQNARSTYYVGIKIYENTFDYSTTDKTAELILTVRNENGEIVTTSSDALEYVTVNDVSGFDITGKTGVFNIVSERPIATTSTTTGVTHNWTFTLTLINLNTDQSINETATLDIDAILQKDRLTDNTLVSYIKGLYESQGLNGIYYHDGSFKSDKDVLDTYHKDATSLHVGDVIDANDGSYRFAGGDYKVADAYKSTYSTINDIIYLDGDEVNFHLKYDSSNANYTRDQAVVKALEDGYIELNNINNYVCFGSDATTCPEDNLYRIIGIFNEKDTETGATKERVKLIKATPAGENVLGAAPDRNGLATSSGYTMPEYKWNGSSTTMDWADSTLNTNVLNGTYLEKLGTKWVDKIADTEWEIGSKKYYDIIETVPAITYKYEYANPRSPQKNIKKVGLMYVSDYSFSIGSQNWTNIFRNSYQNRKYRENSWLYLGIYDLTITRRVDNDWDNVVFSIYHDGDVLSQGTTIDNRTRCILGSIRPTFYLNHNVSYKSGDGSKNNPIRID